MFLGIIVSYNNSSLQEFSFYAKINRRMKGLFVNKKIITTLVMIVSYNFQVWGYSKSSLFSKITIVSKKMECFPAEHKECYCFEYKDDVKVTFADQSTITSDTLKILVFTEKTSKHDNNLPKTIIPSVIKKIDMNGNIKVKSLQDIIQADHAEIV